MTDPGIWTAWGPFYHVDGIIYAKSPPKGSFVRLIDARAWGFLTGKGHGALALDFKSAAAIRDHMGDTLAALLNERYLKP